MACARKNRRPWLRFFIDHHEANGFALSLTGGNWELDGVLPFWKPRSAAAVQFFLDAYRRELTGRFAASKTGTLRVACVPDVLRSTILPDLPVPERVKALQLEFSQRRAALPTSLKRFKNTARVDLIHAYFEGALDLAKLDLARLRAVVWYGQGTTRPDVPLDHYPRVKEVVSKHWSEIPDW